MQQYDGKKIGERIRIARLQKGLKQKALCDLTNLSQSTLSDIENGKGSISVELLYKIANTLDTSVFHILGEKILDDNVFTLEELQKFIINKRNKTNNR